MNDIVILLHGIGHSRWNMAAVDRALRRQGYRTLNISYPSRRHDLAALSQFLNARLLEEDVWKNYHRVHFVTHSMGGLLGRRYLADHRDSIPSEKTGRFVMIAPPNGGSEVANLLQNFPPYRWLFGPAGQELITAVQEENKIAPWYETGIIAGTAGRLYPLANRILPGENDGRVTLKSTILLGMKDHVTVNATHSFISWRPATHNHIIHFLHHGEFSNVR